MTSCGSEVIGLCVCVCVCGFGLGLVVNSSVIQSIMFCYLNQTQCYTLEILPSWDNGWDNRET